MPKKPNFDFERREREKAKAIKLAEKAKAKEAKKAGITDETTPADPTGPAPSEQ